MSHFHCYMISHFGIYQNLAIPLLCINFVVVNNPLISLAYNNKLLFHALDIVNDGTKVAMFLKLTFLNITSPLF